MQTARARLAILPLLLVILGLAVLAACGDDDDSPAEAAPSPSVTPSPEPAEPTDPSPPPGGQIGRPEFDALADDFVGRDVTAVVDAIDLTELACKTVQGLGGPPECLPGEPEGTVVSVMPFASCEGEYKREQQVVPLVEALVERNPELVAAFSLKDPGTPDRPIGEYGILFSLDAPAGGDPLGLMLGVDGQGNIISMWAGCGVSAEEIYGLHAGSTVLLPLG